MILSTLSNSNIHVYIFVPFGSFISLIPMLIFIDFDMILNPTFEFRLTFMISGSNLPKRSHDLLVLQIVIPICSKVMSLGLSVFNSQPFFMSSSDKICQFHELQNLRREMQGAGSFRKSVNCKFVNYKIVNCKDSL